MSLLNYVSRNNYVFLLPLHIRLFFDEVIRQNVNAFLKEAERRFGQESIPRQKPEVYAKR